MKKFKLQVFGKKGKKILVPKKGAVLNQFAMLHDHKSVPVLHTASTLDRFLK
jgi:hypothetical protein